eukprot:UN09267
MSDLNMHLKGLWFIILLMILTRIVQSFIDLLDLPYLTYFVVSNLKNHAPDTPRSSYNNYEVYMRENSINTMEHHTTYKICLSKRQKCVSLGIILTYVLLLCLCVL